MPFRRWYATLTLLVALVLPACSSGNAGPSGVSPTTAAPAGAAPLVPARDTPFGSAPKPMRQAWSLYTVTLIPGRDVLSSVPPAPPVRNMTGGRVSDGVARQWAEELVRRRHLVQWALANGQIDFLDWFGERTYADDTWRVALEHEPRITLPDCATYPTSLSLWIADSPQDPVVLADHVDTYFSMAFAGPCSVGVPAGTVTSVATAWTGTHVVLVAGHEFTDSLIGNVWRGNLTDCASAPPGHETQCSS